MYGDITHGIYGGFNTTRDLENHRFYWFNATRDTIYMNSETISIREWLSYGHLSGGVTSGGLYTLNGNRGSGTLTWGIATK